MSRIINILILLGIASTVTPAQNNTTPNVFRASVVKVNITPESPQWLRGYDPRQSTGILDSLYHKIVAFDDGRQQFYLICSDVLGIPLPEYDRVTNLLREQLGIDPAHVWWAATHTHSAPEIAAHFKGIPFPSMSNRSKLASGHVIDTAYTAWFERRLIDGLRRARARLAPARLGVGWGFSQANINRRGKDADGKVSLGLNPDGDVDRSIGLMRIEKADGTPLVLIANYAIHGTVLGQQNTLISADVPGVVSSYVEERIGAPVVFINGAAGDLAPIYSVYPDPIAGHLKQFRRLLGDRILEANTNIAVMNDKIELTIGSLTVETPRRPGLGWSDDLAKYTREINSDLHMVKLPVRFLKINSDIAIWSAPLELFCSVSKEIRDKSPFSFTFYFGYTNGSLGYLPAASAWQEGGYEPGVSPFTPAAHKDLHDAVVGYLQGELRSE